MIGFLRQRGKTVSVPRNIVYTENTINRLVDATMSATLDHGGETLGERRTRLESMIDRFSCELGTHIPVPTLTSSTTTHKGSIILLTGSTGSLGCHILASLLQDPSVERIYCLARSLKSDVRARIHAQFGLYGLPTSLLEHNLHRVTFMEAHLAAPDLAVEPKRLSEVKRLYTSGS